VNKKKVKAGVNPGFFLGEGAPLRNDVSDVNKCYVRKPQVIFRGG